MPPSTAGRDVCRYMVLGMNPGVVCEGRPGFFQNKRLSEPPEIHRGHKLSCFLLAERRGSLAPRLRTANFNLEAWDVPMRKLQNPSSPSSVKSTTEGRQAPEKSQAPRMKSGNEDGGSKFFILLCIAIQS